MKTIHRYILSVLLTAAAAACKKPYLPPASSTGNSYLVVEGVINSGGDSTIIKLSKTVQLSGNTKANELTGCTVTVEDEQGAATPLQETAIGKYTVPSIPVDAAKKYRLHIITRDGEEYGSDYMAVKQTPAIDDIPYDVPSNTIDTGLQIYVSTHDATNNTRYYRWEYTEAWKIMSMYQSNFIIDGSKIRARTVAEQSTVCFQGDTSGNIYIGTSAKLAQDVINKAPLALIPTKSLKLKYRYSILVKQYALTKDEYQFWQNLQKNTEQLGSIFDAQPSQLSGNLHNLKNAAEPVIGYVGITNVQTKRIYINGGDLPTNGVPDYPYACELDTALYEPEQIAAAPPLDLYDVPATGTVLSKLMAGGGYYEPCTILYAPCAGCILIKGYTYTTLPCADCRVRGKNTPPPFWVN